MIDNKKMGIKYYNKKSEMIKIGSTKDKNIYMIDNGINDDPLIQHIVYNYKLQLYGLPIEIQEIIMEQCHKWIFKNQVLKIQRPVPSFKSIKLDYRPVFGQYNQPQDQPMAFFERCNDGHHNRPELFGDWEKVEMTKEKVYGLQCVRSTRNVSLYTECPCITNGGRCGIDTNQKYSKPLERNDLDLKELVSFNNKINICGRHKKRDTGNIINDMGYIIKNNCICKICGNGKKTRDRWDFNRVKKWHEE